MHRHKAVNGKPRTKRKQATMTTKSDFPEFFQSYLHTALWSSTISEDSDGEPGERDGEPFDKHFSTDDFSAEALETLRAHAFSFWSRMWYYLNYEESKRGEKPEASQAGHDFWLTQNGHGAGFWDGYYPTYGDTFTKLAKCYPVIDLYVTEKNEVGAE